MKYGFLFLILLFFLYIFSLSGRRRNPGLEPFRSFRYAHRGLHDSVHPENSLSAFQAAVDHGYGAELDVHLLKDGSLAVFHDSDLFRVTGKQGHIQDLTAEDLSGYPLSGTEQTIPLFSQVLSVFCGKTPLIVELKVDDNNYGPLCDAVCKMLDGYSGRYCLESFDPRCIRYLRKHYPDRIRGQLSEDYLGRGAKSPFLVKLLCGWLMTNFLTKPDFIAYRFEDRKNLHCTIARKLWGIQGVSWTLKTKEDFESAVSEGWIPIFENIIP